MYTKGYEPDYKLLWNNNNKNYRICLFELSGYMLER